MNIFDTIRDGRPAVDPMPLARRRSIREALFGVGDDSTPRTVGSRSESGAVVSTAPHGIRIPVQRRPRWHGWAKIAAGFVVVGLVIAGLQRLSPNAPTATTSRSTVPESRDSTVPETSTEPPPTRTGVTRNKPLLLPRSLLRTDSATIGPVARGATSLILESPTGANLWIAEFDGEADLTSLDYRQVGPLFVAPTSAPGTPASYRIAVPCGLIIMNDTPGLEPFGPEVQSLIASMTLGLDATLNATFPDGWNVVSVGRPKRSYSAQFQVPSVEGTVVPIQLVQIPNGDLAQLAFGGAQLDPITFLGEPAFINAAPAIPGVTTIYWEHEATVFSVSSGVVGVEALEGFVEMLEPATAPEWSERLSAPEPEESATAPGCTPQPSFGPAFDP